MLDTTIHRFETFELADESEPVVKNKRRCGLITGNIIAGALQLAFLVIVIMASIGLSFKSEYEGKCHANVPGIKGDPIIIEISLWDSVQWLLGYSIPLYAVGALFLVLAWDKNDVNDVLPLSLFVWCCLSLLSFAGFNFFSPIFNFGQDYANCVVVDNGMWIWVVIAGMPSFVLTCVVVGRCIFVCCCGKN